MRRARYQRYNFDRYERNGLEDGWMRPLERAPNAWNESVHHKLSTTTLADGRSIKARYIVMWLGRGVNDYPRGRFDDLEKAHAYIATQPPHLTCAGIWDTKTQMWAQ